MKNSSLLGRISIAWNGIKVFAKQCENFKIHASAAVGAITLGFILEIGRTDWLIILTAIALVFITEMINEAVEILCNHLHPDQHSSIGKVKDIAAGAVLIASIFSLIVGIYIYLPGILNQFKVWFN